MKDGATTDRAQLVRRKGEPVIRANWRVQVEPEAVEDEAVERLHLHAVIDGAARGSLDQLRTAFARVGFCEVRRPAKKCVRSVLAQRLPNGLGMSRIVRLFEEEQGSRTPP